MRKTWILGRVATTVVLLISALLLPSARAQSAAEKLYKAKCAMCHSEDGSGDTPAGKKMSARDFRLAEVQKQTDAQLIEITVKGKNKMPGFDKKLTEEQIKQLVAYIRELAKKTK
ncbi:MAG TPA: cytochrome c [Candidatus Acidoferrales bacterium]|nr:cytochrome c [Candidatus Acidoferrales bacterium]